MPRYRFPGRIEDQVASIAEEFNAVATRLEDIYEVCLADAMFAWSRLDLASFTVFDNDIGDIREMLGVAVPVADMVEAPLGPGAVSQIRDLMYRCTDAEPGSGLGVIIQDNVLA